MRKIALAVAVILAAAAASAQPTRYANPGTNCRLVQSVNYTQVVDTTTRTSDASASVYTIFSTMTISNPLPKNGDTLTVTCAGNIGPAAEIRTIATIINGVVVSSRTASIGTSGHMLPWRNDTELLRTAAGAQIRNCITSAPGPQSSNCNGTPAVPAIGSGTNTLDETATWTITCGAANVTAKSTSFLLAKAVYCPGPEESEMKMLIALCAVLALLAGPVIANDDFSSGPLDNGHALQWGDKSVQIIGDASAETLVIKTANTAAISVSAAGVVTATLCWPSISSMASSTLRSSRRTPSRP